MAVTTFTLPFVDTPAFYSGTAQTNVVPSLYPVAIDGRPYLIDVKSGKYQRTHEQRVRDSQDNSTAPGEAAINPGGLWRRGQDSWHYGSGQQYADMAESQDYRFYKSKGVNPWVKGQLSLHNKTIKSVGTGAPTTGTAQLIINGSKLFVIDGTGVKYATDPAGTWTSIASPASTTACLSLATDGTSLFAAFTGTTSATTGVYKTDATSPSTWTRQIHDAVKKMAYVNGRLICSFDNILYDGSFNLYTGGGNISAGNTLMTHRDVGFQWVGFAAGSGFIYAAGNVDGVSLIYKTTIEPDATSLSAPSIALQLPLGEAITSLDSYLGFIFIGTNKGVRVASSDGAGNLSAGSLIPTDYSVYDFVGDGRFVWFTWTNFDGLDGGLGRLDMSVNIAPNTPAFATDLMYTNLGVVRSVVNFGSKRVFSIDAVGVIYEDTTSVVDSGNIEFGTHRWGIPDRKFVAKFDVRTEPLKGSVEALISHDHSDYQSLGTFVSVGGSEYTYTGTDIKTIEADFKLVITSTASEGPIVTRWMARAYAAPFRSEVFSIPVILHHKIRPRDREVYMDPEEELDILNNLIHNPRIITLQLGTRFYSVITEDIEWYPTDSTGNTWSWDGTANVMMRSVEN